MNGRKKDGFNGQEQHYFLAELTNPQAVIRFDGSHEFRAARWLPPAYYDLNWIGGMKRDVYAGVFRDFFGIEPRDSEIKEILLTCRANRRFSARPHVHTYRLCGFIRRAHRRSLVGLPERFGCP